MTDQTGPAGRPGLALALAALWALALLWGAAQYVTLPVFALVPTIMTAFLAPGLILMLMIGWMALRGGDGQFLRETVTQLVLALCIWPAAAVLLGAAGPGVITSLGLGFAVARLAAWVGAYLSPGLRAFGDAATFLPSVLVALWALWQLVSGLG